jgi:hypothetical protein
MNYQKPAANCCWISMNSFVALRLQVFGAIVDYTDHLKKMAVLSAAVLTVIEAIKIGTVEVSLAVDNFLC